MAAKVTRVGSLDIQFQTTWDSVKANQLVQSVQQTIAAVNKATFDIANLQQSGGGGDVTAPVQIANTSGIGPQVAVGPGLHAGQVLIALDGTNAAFGQLQFGEIADTDPASFAAPHEGDVIMFHTGFWTAMPDPNTGLGLSDPGQNALVMWNEAGHAFAWAIPTAGGGIKLTTGAISVDATQLDHHLLEGLQFTVASGGTIVANDHPQYAMLAAANTWPLQQTFTAGLVSNANIVLNGNLEQSGAEPEWRITNTDDVTDEGTWRIHAEPGQFIISSVSDDGSDGENWFTATRIAEIVDQVNVQSNSFLWNGAQLLTTDYVPPTQSNPTFISPITVPQGITLTGVEPFFTIGDTQSAANEGYWQLHAEPGMLIWSTLYDDGITWGENWLTVTRSDELVDAASINFQGGALRFNGEDVLTQTSLQPGLNVFFTTNAAGQLLVNSATPGAGSSWAITDGTHTVAAVTNLSVTGGTVGGATPNATLTITPSSWTITDGTHTVAGVTNLSVTGGTVGGTTPNATLTIVASAPASPNTSVQFNNGGVFGGSANFEWNGTTVAMTATTTNTMMSIGGAAATNISLITAQQTGQAAWLMYLPASTSDLRFFNSVNGDAFIIDDIGDLYSITNSSGFGPGYAGAVGIRLNNLNASMQTSIDFAKSSVLMGRLRSDFAGNLTYVSTAGIHGFFVGGDSGVGAVAANISANQVQVTRGGSVANSTFAGAGRAILMLNGSSDNLIDFSDNTANRGYLYAISTEMRAFSAAGVVTQYAAGVLTSQAVYAAFTNASSRTGFMVTGTGTFQRNDTRGGYLDGNYPTYAAGTDSGCIYSIGGGSFVPGASSLNTIYGIGYTLGNVTGIAVMGQAANWGLYVAQNGTGNIFFDAAGHGWFNGTLTSIGALQVASGNVTGGFTVGGALTCSNFITGAYLEQTSANNENPTISQVMVTNGADNFLRKASLANFASQMAPATNAASGSITLNGIIIKWGSGTASAAGTSNSYNVAFPTGVYQVVWTEADGVISGAYSSSLTKSSASAFTAFTGKGTAITISWLAIGH